ncbi:MAG TPA: YlxR family protein [Candidatus Binataceae bacterium]|nr:YlxR family protein [Candidatus Binataceae bacterium]
MACRQVDSQDAMVRLAALPEGVRIDTKGKLGGRGGYLHRRRRCLEMFVKAKVVRFNSLRRSLDRSERLNLVNLLTGQLAPDAELE